MIIISQHLSITRLSERAIYLIDSTDIINHRETDLLSVYFMPGHLIVYVQGRIEQAKLDVGEQIGKV